MKKTNYRHALFSVVFIFMLATFIHASTTTTINATAPAKAIEQQVNEVVCSLFNLVMMVAGGIASLMIIIAGIK